MINQEALKAIFLKEIKELLEKYCDYNILPGRVNSIKKHYEEELLKAEMKVIENEKIIERNNNTLSNAYMDKASGEIPNDEYIIISGRLREHNNSLASQNTIWREKVDSIKDTLANTSRQDYLIKKYKNLSELTRELLEAFIDVIYVGESTGKANKDRENAEYNLEVAWKI